MFPSWHPQGELTTYEYNPQATVDHEDDDAIARGTGKSARPPAKRLNYRPIPLRWPFIVSQILILCVAIGLIVWAEKAMPNSDSTAIIDARRALPQTFPTLLRGVRRANVSAPSTTTAQETVVTVLSQSGVPESTQVSLMLVSTSTPESASNSAAPTTSQTANPSRASTTILSASATTTSADARTTTLLSHTTDHSRSTGPSSTVAKSSSRSVTSLDKTSPSSRSRAASASPSHSGSSSSLSRGSSAARIMKQSTPSSTSVSSSTSSVPKLKSPSSSPTKSSSTAIKKIFLVSGSSTISTIDPASASLMMGESFKLITTTSLHTSNIVVTSTSTTRITSVVTVPPTTTTFNTTSQSTITSTHTTTVIIVHSGTTFSTVLTETTSLPVTQTIAPSFTEGSFVLTTFTTESTIVRTSFGTVTGSAETSVATVPVTSTVVVTFPTTSVVEGTTSETVVTSEVPYYVTLGPTVITEVETVMVPYSPSRVPEKIAPVTVVETRTAGGEVHTVVRTFAPQTHVVDGTGGLRTQVYTPPPQTHVTHIGGTLTTSMMVFTPSVLVGPVSLNVESTIGGKTVTIVNSQGPKTIVTSQGGSLVTLVTTPPPRTQVQIIGGTVTTVGVVSTLEDGQEAVFVDVETTVGGTPVTFVRTQSPQTIVTSSGGSLVTVVTTPPPKTEVSKEGGTLATVEVLSTIAGFQPITYTVTKDIGGTMVTEVIVTTPTTSNPITVTLDATVGGTVSTIVQTFEPSTIVTEISGTLTTIVSTPSPSTMLSTESKSTITRTTTSTPSEIPSATRSGGPTSIASLIVTVREFNLTAADYFLGTFFSTFLAIMLVIPLRIIDLNAKLYQPFNSLAQPGGALGSEAMTLQYTGLMGFITPVVTLFQGYPVPFITTVIVACASFMVPLAAEAISLKLHGHCREGSSENCASALGVSSRAANVLIGVIACIILLLLLLLYCTRNWVTGVNASPWSIAGMASLARNQDVRTRQTSEGALRQAVADKRYGIRYFEGSGGREEYGILLMDESGQNLTGEDDEGSQQNVDGMGLAGSGGGERTTLPFMTLRYPWRIAFLLFIVGLLVLILYYHLTLNDLHTPFNKFMYSHSFGVRFLFAILGVMITFCWQAFFIAVSIMVPYQLMSRRPQPPLRSILLRRPTNPFSGIYVAARHRHAFLLFTSASAILSEFLPILLSNVPYNLSQTRLSHDICTLFATAALSAMAACIMVSFLVRWPHMPVDPRSVAGALWYVTESPALLAGLKGVALLDGAAREDRVRSLGGRYYYGLVEGAGDRVGVDAHPGHGETVDTAYRGSGRGD